MATIRDKVEGLIADSGVMIFSKSYCPYCRATKRLLENLGSSYAVLELDTEPDGRDIQDYLATRPEGQRTVPNIFINQKHVGGNSDLQALHKQGKLAALLKASATPRL